MEVWGVEGRVEVGEAVVAGGRDGEDGDDLTAEGGEGVEGLGAGRTPAGWGGVGRADCACGALW